MAEVIDLTRKREEKQAKIEQEQSAGFVFVEISDSNPVHPLLMKLFKDMFGINFGSKKEGDTP